MFHFSLEQGHSLPTMLVVTVVAALLTSYFYGKAYRLLAPMRWRILFALRLTAVVLIVLLLFRPVLSLEKEVVQRRALIFLVDSSASMATADDASGNTRFELARLRVADWWSRLAKDFDLHLLEFSDRASPLERPDDLARVQPTGEATSLTRAFSAAAQKVPRRDVEAVVLLSDGIHNAAGDPVQTARRLGLKVHAIGVGNSLRGSPSYKDIQVTGLECPDQLPVNNRAKVTAFVDAVGYGGRVVKVFLEEDGKQIDQAELVLDDVEGARRRSFFNSCRRSRAAIRTRPAFRSRPMRRSHKTTSVPRWPKLSTPAFAYCTWKEHFGPSTALWLTASCRKTRISSFAPWCRRGATFLCSAPTWKDSSLAAFPPNLLFTRNSTFSCSATSTARTGNPNR